MQEHIRRGLEADHTDTSWRLAEEWRRNRALAAAREAGRELITSAGIERLFGRNGNAIRQAVHRGRITGGFEVASVRGGSSVRLFFLSDAVEVWGEPNEAQLAQLRVEAGRLAINGAIWAILDREWT